MNETKRWFLQQLRRQGGLGEEWLQYFLRLFNGGAEEDDGESDGEEGRLDDWLGEWEEFFDGATERG